MINILFGVLFFSIYRKWIFSICWSEKINKKLFTYKCTLKYILHANGYFTFPCNIYTDKIYHNTWNLLGFYSFIIKDNISSFKTEHHPLACKYTDRLVDTWTSQVENAYDFKWTLFMRFLRVDNYYLIILESHDYMYIKPVVITLQTSTGKVHTSRVEQKRYLMFHLHMFYGENCHAINCKRFEVNIIH